MGQKPVEIYVDADAMPRTALAIVRSVGKAFYASVMTVSSIRHELGGDNHISVDPAPESTDMEIIRRIARDKACVVVTQDYGLAALVLAKGARALSPTGRIYTADNIDALLAERAFSAKIRRSRKNRIKGQGPRPRTAEDDERFEQALRSIILATYSDT